MATTRKALSKRVRFEIFKRDGFRCGYCGITAINSVLHVDHVKPVAEGGANAPENLLTACADCNGGKSDVPLDKRKLKSSFTSEEEREHAEQIRAYLEVQREIVGAKKDAEAIVLDRWHELCGEWHYMLPRYLPSAIREQGMDVVMEAVEIVARKGIIGHDAVRYFCGIMRKRREEAEAAKVVVKTFIVAEKREAEWACVLNALLDYWDYRIGCREGRTAAFAVEFKAAARDLTGCVGDNPPMVHRRDLYRVIDWCSDQVDPCFAFLWVAKRCTSERKVPAGIPDYYTSSFDEDPSADYLEAPSKES